MCWRRWLLMLTKVRWLSQGIRSVVFSCVGRCAGVTILRFLLRLLNLLRLTVWIRIAHRWSLESRILSHLLPRNSRLDRRCKCGIVRISCWPSSGSCGSSRSNTTTTSRRRSRNRSRS